MQGKADEMGRKFSICNFTGQQWRYLDGMNGDIISKVGTRMGRNYISGGMQENEGKRKREQNDCVMPTSALARKKMENVQSVSKTMYTVMNDRSYRR